MVIPRIIDSKDSTQEDEFYFLKAERNYKRKIDNIEEMTINQSGNFYANTFPIKNKNILDGGNSSNDSSQFIEPIIGGV